MRAKIQKNLNWLILKKIAHCAMPPHRLWRIASDDDLNLQKDIRNCISSIRNEFVRPRMDMCDMSMCYCATNNKTPSRQCTPCTISHDDLLMVNYCTKRRICQHNLIFNKGINYPIKKSNFLTLKNLSITQCKKKNQKIEKKKLFCSLLFMDF